MDPTTDPDADVTRAWTIVLVVRKTGEDREVSARTTPPRETGITREQELSLLWSADAEMYGYASERTIAIGYILGGMAARIAELERAADAAR